MSAWSQPSRGQALRLGRCDAVRARSVDIGTYVGRHRACGGLEISTKPPNQSLITWLPPQTRFMSVDRVRSTKPGHGTKRIMSSNLDRSLVPPYTISANNLIHRRTAFRSPRTPTTTAYTNGKIVLGSRVQERHARLTRSPNNPHSVAHRACRCRRRTGRLVPVSAATALRRGLVGAL